MTASSWAEAAISWVEADVSSVEAETCSALAEDCSATLATSITSAWMRPVPSEMRSTAVAISSRGSVTSMTALSMAANASRDRSTVRAPASVRSAPLSTTPTTRAVSVLDLRDQRADRAGGGGGALGELAHLVGDNGEARPARRRGRPRWRR